MSVLAAQLVDRVLPHVPIRQWVFTMPVPVRYQLAFNAGLTRAVLRVCLRTVFGWLRQRAARRGIIGGRCGAVTAIQRFGYRRSYCDLLHEHSLDLPWVPVQESLNGAARRSSLAAVSSGISSHHTRRCAWKS
jgi:hypothetical protein